MIPYSGRTRVAGGRAFHHPDPLRRARRTGWLALLGFLGFASLAAAAGLAVGPPGAPLAGAWWCAGAWLPGLAAWLVWRRVDVGLHRKHRAMQLWGWAILAQVAWPGIAPSLHSTAAGYAALVAASALTGLAIRAFWPLDRTAAAMLLPYSAAIAFAAWPGAGQ